MQDVTILYQGGSGGFALFYYLLLSGQYQTGLKYQTVQELIDHQFGVQLSREPRAWKLNEHWPDNNQCKHNNAGPRLFLICNPCWTPEMTQHNLSISQNTHTILLYTDLKLQLRMAWEKKAYWFTDISRRAFGAPIDNKQYIKKIISSADNGIDPMISTIIKKFEVQQTVRLENFISDKTIPGFGEPTLKQVEFLEMWYNLQPIKAKKLLNRPCTTK